ncbi:TatD family hydrolase [Pseudarthrobacter sp. NPDC058329]|uniref:TatD family hydrolase n=1 Tax=Pseudarthrobacter sp. NPDC058329 TaxID=3346448 RepID=UPI0036D99DF7
MIPERLLDTHCHVSAYDDPVAVLGAAEQAGIAVVAITEDPDEYRRLKTRLGRREYVDVAIGLHPLRATTFGPNELARFFRLLPQSTWIGEVGLDFSRAGAGTARAQQKVFDIVLAEASRGHHPLSVHSRGAEKEVIRKLADAEAPAVLHWYTGPLTLVNEAVASGLYFSFNIAMTRSRKFPSLIQAVPRDRVLLETDGPFAKVQGRAAHPHELNDVATALAQAWGMNLGETTRTIIANQNRFLAQS